MDIEQIPLCTSYTSCPAPESSTGASSDFDHKQVGTCPPSHKDSQNDVYTRAARSQVTSRAKLRGHRWIGKDRRPFSPQPVGAYYCFAGGFASNDAPCAKIACIGNKYSNQNLSRGRSKPKPTWADTRPFFNLLWCVPACHFVAARRALMQSCCFFAACDPSLHVRALGSRAITDTT